MYSTLQEADLARLYHQKHKLVRVKEAELLLATGWLPLIKQKRNLKGSLDAKSKLGKQKFRHSCIFFLRT